MRELSEDGVDEMKGALLELLGRAVEAGAPRDEVDKVAAAVVEAWTRGVESFRACCEALARRYPVPSGWEEHDVMCPALEGQACTCRAWGVGERPGEVQ